MVKIVELFRTPRQRKTLGRQTVVAITQEETYGRGMSLDVDTYVRYDTVRIYLTILIIAAAPCTE